MLIFFLCASALVGALVFYLFFYRSWRRNRQLQHLFQQHWRAILKAQVPMYRRLPAALRHQLEQHLQLFIAGHACLMTRAYENLRHSLSHHHRPWLDSYGATEPAEFFAVLTETFFQQPDHLRKEQPEVYEALCSFYRLDPLD